MKRWMKIGILVLVVGLIAASAITAYAQGPRGGMGRGGMGVGGHENSLVAVAAETLGLEVDALLTELQAGKTIAEVAAEQGVETQAIIDAFVAPRSIMLTAAVEAGYLTQAQADARLALIEANAAARLEQTFTFGFGRWGGGPRGMGRGMHGCMMGNCPFLEEAAPEATAEPAA